MPNEITVLGCGEAFDDALPNNSYLVRIGGSVLLLDCGYSIPPRLWHFEHDDSAVDLIYISHAHADHYFGLPAVLGRMWEQGRTMPLTILQGHFQAAKAAGLSASDALKSTFALACLAPSVAGIGQ